MTTSFAESALHHAALAAQLLGWDPDSFWRATPADLAHALGSPAGGAPLGRAELERMLKAEGDG